MLEEVLSKIPDVEPEAIERLRAHFDGVEDLLRSRDYEVAMVSGLPLARAKEIMEFLRAHDPTRVAEGEVHRCEKCGKLVLNDTVCDSCRKGLCPRCGSYMDDLDECPVCGWTVSRGRSIAADFKMRWSSEESHLESLLEKYTALLEKYPNDPRLWEVRGEILEKMGRREEAREAFKKAYDLYVEKEGRAPTSIIARLGAADGLIEAFRRYAALAETERTNPKLWEVAADLAARVGDRDYEVFARERARIYSDRWMEGGTARGMGAKRGFVNGRQTRGFTNGRVNGQVNGHVNGRVNGMVNGAINGVVSRIVKEGLINGNGLVNGNTIARKIKPPRRPRWQRMVIASALLLIILLSPLLLYTFFVPYVHVGVDGSFEEWKSVPAIWDTRGDVAPDYIDIVEYRIIGMGESSYIYIHTAGPLFNRSSGIYVFIDADGHPETGYPAAGIGADYMVEVYGWDDHLFRNGFYTYNATARGAWNGFSRVSGVPVAVSGNRMEMMIPVNVTGGYLAIVSTDYRGDVDTGDLKFAPARELIGLRVSDASTIAPVDIWTPLVTVEYFTMGRCSVRWLNFAFEGTALPMDISFRLIYRGENVSYAAPDREGYVNFTFSTPISLAGNGTLSVEVMPRGTTSLGRTVSVVPVSAGTDALLTIWDEREDRAYVGYVPSDVLIDGGFQDWSGIVSDPVGDVLDASGSPADVSYTTIDIVGYAVERTPRDTKFLISTHGRIMGGMDVPVVRNKTLVDSDRDTIPDYLDPRPHDFDNDGVPDANQTVLVGSTPYPDVDGDGVPDYPDGDDYWLNTTIPNATEYGEWAGRRVSVYIGPVEGIRRIYGNDTIAIFVDADGNASTGYSAPFFAGADYLLEITGRGGVPGSVRLFRWYGGGWHNGAGAAEVAVTYRALEAFAPLTLAPGARFFVVATDWRGDRDTGHPSAGFLTRAVDPPLIEIAQGNGTSAGEMYGASATPLGDINGDGYDDFAVGAPGTSSYGYQNGGAVYIFLGWSGISDINVSRANATVYGDVASLNFGTSLSAGDVDGDGTVELVVGAPGGECVYVFEPPLSGVHSVSSLLPSVVMANNTGRFGHAVDVIGDFNGDAFPDIAVGAPDASAPFASAGEVTVLSGSDLSVIANYTVPYYGASFSWSLAGGDVNGDGLADLIVGAPGAWGSGECYVYYGSTSPPSTVMVRQTLGDSGIYVRNLWGSLAQSFVAPYDCTLAGVVLYLLDDGADDGGDNSLTVFITDDSAGAPGSIISSRERVDVPADGSYHMVFVPFMNPVSLTAGSTYWVVMRDPLRTNYMVNISRADPYANGNIAVRLLGSWVNISTDDMRFYLITKPDVMVTNATSGYGRAVGTADFNNDRVEDIMIGEPDAGRIDILYSPRNTFIYWVTPAYAYTYYNVSGVNITAQYLEVGTATTITRLRVYLVENATDPGPLTVSLYADAGGTPGNIIYSETVAVPNDPLTLEEYWALIRVEWPVGPGVYWVGVNGTDYSTVTDEENPYRAGDAAYYDGRTWTALPDNDMLMVVDTMADDDIRGPAGFGSALGYAGDLDGDGMNDIYVCADGYFYVLDTKNATERYSYPAGEGPCAYLGDVNGDGIPDYFVGIPSYESSTGMAYVVSVPEMSLMAPLALAVPLLFLKRRRKVQVTANRASRALSEHSTHAVRGRA